MELAKEIKIFMKSFYRKEGANFVPNIDDFKTDLQWLIDNDRFEQLFQEITRAMQLYKKEEDNA